MEIHFTTFHFSHSKIFATNQINQFHYASIPYMICIHMNVHKIINLSVGVFGHSELLIAKMDSPEMIECRSVKWNESDN